MFSTTKGGIEAGEICGFSGQSGWEQADAEAGVGIQHSTVEGVKNVVPDPGSSCFLVVHAAKGWLCLKRGRNSSAAKVS